MDTLASLCSSLFTSQTGLPRHQTTAGFKSWKLQVEGLWFGNAYGCVIMLHLRAQHDMDSASARCGNLSVQLKTQIGPWLRRRVKTYPSLHPTWRCHDQSAVQTDPVHILLMSPLVGESTGVGWSAINLFDKLSIGTFNVHMLMWCI